MAKDVFKEGSRRKVRFTTSKGVITMEDLWTLNESLVEELHSDLTKELESFTKSSGLFSSSSNTKSREESLIRLKLSIIEEVAAYREEAKVRNAKAKERRELRSKLLAQANSAEDAEIEGLSKEEALARLAELDNEDLED